MKSVGVVDGGLFTESYCNICNAQLISESQRTAHYESKKHANKVRLFYMLHPEDGGPPSKRLRIEGNSESDMLNKCCTLCNMFFTSAIVAQSHYQGKTHAKRVRLVLGEPPNLPTAITRLRSSYSCSVCSVVLNSIEQYHAHLQGSKHQNK
uniref:Zgc:171482 n=1 Tax=Xiphophorus maculatus TaxID=8083 RepID=M3ZK99_XIPMA